MAIARPEVEWFYSPSTYWKEYGLLCLAGKWAVVKAEGFNFNAEQPYKVITDWVDDRKTAIGFLKLLKEN
jgi:hypothetical protein